MKLEIEMSEAQYSELKEVAKSAGISMSEWLLTSLSGEDTPDWLQAHDAKMKKVYAEMRRPPNWLQAMMRRCP